MAYPKYDDGLDADGYPIKEEPRPRYLRGSEEDAGNFKPISIGQGVAAMVERICRFREIGRNCDSLIEEELGAAILMFFERAGHPLKLCLFVDLKDAADDLLLVPQFGWSFYRSDWAVLNPKRTGALLIECDGKEFHSSADQVAHDAKKDAAAHDRGYLTMRFPGWRIHKDADGLAQKVYDAVYGGL